MFAKTLTGLTMVLGMGLLGTTPVEGQLRGRVVLHEGPIAVDVVFGPQYRQTRARPVRRIEPVPVRYRVGMTLRELDHYLDRIEYEYDLYRRMSAREARFRLGWSRSELRSYVRFLRNERRFLRDERRRLEREWRADAWRFERPGRGQGRGRGHRGAIAQVW